MIKSFNEHFQYNESDNNIDDLNNSNQNIEVLYSISSSLISSNFYSSSSKEDSEEEIIVNNINNNNTDYNDSDDEDQNNNKDINVDKRNIT